MKSSSTFMEELTITVVELPGTIVDLGIKLVILEYDGKLKPDKFMYWLVCVGNIFAHMPMTEHHHFY